MNAQIPHTDTMTQAAIQNGAVLRAIAGAASPLTSPGDVAKAAGVPTKNIARTMLALATDGLAKLGGVGEGWRLTDAGGRALQALDVWEGRAAPGGEPADPTGVFHVLHHHIRPNPLNTRKLNLEIPAQREAMDGLKSQIVAAGEVLQNLVVFPADAEGVHTLFAGERRWTAVGELIEEGAWPRDRPLRVIQRENTPGQTAFIALVENSQVPLTVLERARGYQTLCADTGMSGREAALRTGWDIKSVQQYLQVLRDGDPANIAAHEAGDPDWTWEALRKSVQTAREGGEDEAEAQQQGDLEEVAPVGVSPMGDLGLIELAWKLDRYGFEHEGQRWAQLNGSAYLNEIWRQLRDSKLVTAAMPYRYGRLDCIVTLSPTGRERVSRRYPDGVTDQDLQAARALIGKRESVGAGEDQGYSCYFLNDAIGAANIEGARRVREEPTPQEILALMEIGSAISIRPDFYKKEKGGAISDRSIIEPTNLNDRLVGSLRWGSLIDCGYDSKRGKSLIRWTDEAQALVAAHGYNGVNDGEISRARIAAGLSPDLVRRNDELVYANAWLNSRAIPDAASSRPPVVSGGGASMGVSKPKAEPVQRPLSPYEALALLELAKATDAAVAEGKDLGGGWVKAGKYWLDTAASELRGLGLIAFSHQLKNGPHAGVLAMGRARLQELDYVLPYVLDSDLARARELAGHAGWDGPGYVTEWLNPEAGASAEDLLKPGASAAGFGGMSDEEAEADDDGTDQDCTKLTELVQAIDGGRLLPDIAASFMRQLELTPPFFVNPEDSSVVDSHGRDVLHVDYTVRDNESGLQAVAQLAAHALNCLLSPAAAGHPTPLLQLNAGDLVSVGGTASGYRLLTRSDGGHSQGFMAQSVRLNTGKDYGQPRHITLHAIQAVLPAKEG